MGNSQTQVPNSNSVPVINLEELLQNKTSQINSLIESLQQRSYAVLSLKNKEKIEDFYSSIDCANNFFKQSLEKKETLEQPEGNIGYIHIPEIREFLKYRTAEIESFSKQIEGFNFEKTKRSLDYLAHIGWKSFSALMSKSDDPLTEDEQKDLKECLAERASLSIIHYFSAHQNENIIESEMNNSNLVLNNENDNENEKYHVCSKHQDTGIMTLVMTSAVPGLDVFDTLDQKWRSLEEEIQSIRKTKETEILVLMLGQKAPLFLRSDLQPTIHRVRLSSGIERGSFLYFMDTAKVA